MSWARAIVVVLLLALPGCGFRPLYARSEPQFDAELAAIAVAPIPERMGQLLANSLRDSFNPTGARLPTRWSLVIQLTTYRREVGIRNDGTASRIQFDIFAQFSLNDVRGGPPPFRGQARTITAFDIVENEYSLVVAEEDAQRRAVRELTEQLRDRIALYLRRAETTPRAQS